MKRNLDGLETILPSETNQSQKTTYYEMFRIWTTKTEQIRVVRCWGRGVPQGQRVTAKG